MRTYIFIVLGRNSRNGGNGRLRYVLNGQHKRLCAVSRPIGHKLPPLGQQIAAPIRRLDLVADRVRQRHFGHWSG